MRVLPSNALVYCCWVDSRVIPNSRVVLMGIKLRASDIPRIESQSFDVSSQPALQSLSFKNKAKLQIMNIFICVGCGGGSGVGFRNVIVEEKWN